MEAWAPIGEQICGTQTYIFAKKSGLRDGDFWQMVSDGEEAKKR